MAINNFQWTDELVRKFLHFVTDNGPRGAFFIQPVMDEFKEKNSSSVVKLNIRGNDYWVHKDTLEKMRTASKFASAETEKKEWEIVAYSYMDTPVTYNRTTALADAYLKNFDNPQWWLSKNDGCYKIKSVKRLSDGEVFAVGEAITCGYCIALPIRKIEIVESGCWIEAYDDKINGSCYYCPIGEITKVPPKQKLFTTEDGKDIYDPEQEIFLVYPGTVGGKWNDCKMLAKHIVDSFPAWKRFSTKEKAEEYVLLNKPCLSYNECLAYFLETDNGGFRMLSGKLKELAKQKQGK
jgi:hypothetical protein